MKRIPTLIVKWLANKLGYKLEKINHTPSAINEQCGTY